MHEREPQKQKWGQAEIVSYRPAGATGLPLHTKQRPHHTDTQTFQSAAPDAPGQTRTRGLARSYLRKQ